MPTTCVLGTQWGDEGKARVVDLLADSADVIVRYQGGANAGHTVVFDGETYRLHMVPSGIFRKGKTCVITHGVVVDAKGLLDEVDELRSRGHEVGANLMVSDRAHLVMPWHRALDKAREDAKGAKAHGTTGRGIGPCYADKVSYRGIRVGDLYEEAWFEERLRANLAEKNPVLTKVHGLEPLDFDAIVEEFGDYRERMRPFVGDAVNLLHESIDGGCEILFEGAQAVMLDVDLGSYPYVTGSNSSALGIPAGAGIPPTGLDRVIGVAKAYVTRVGAGPFPTEETGEIGDRLRDAGSEYGTTTGRPRRCGWFDAVTMRYAARSNGITEMAVVKLDVLRGFETLKICIAYERDGERTSTVPSTAPGLAAVKPVYREFNGFDEDVSGARTLDDLPENARNFLRALEEESGARIGLVSVGPSREQVILLDR